MSIVLGIDTGGTYTDGVIIDLASKKILDATKASTTHDDLIVGIRNTIAQLNGENLGDIEYAALSTTLATNAIVEGRGCRVGLLLLGFEPIAPLPPCECHLLPGEISVRGKEVVPLDLAATQKAIAQLKDKVDAVAVSGIFSVHNPEHEETVKAMVRETLGLPVVTAHELTTVLGIQERTVTAILNARLISVIDELMTAVKQALAEKGIVAPIMIVKGDGSLMNESIARERPIETILSGPAASIIGSTFLGDCENGLVLDMGGTTTDIAILRQGRPRLDSEGAKVGGWRTRVNAAEANTFGLGGDSRIYYDYDSKNTLVGPRRCWPVSIICRDYPSYLAELRHIETAKVAMISNELPEGYFLLRKPAPHMELSPKQLQIIEVLKDGPHTIVEIARAIDTTPNFLNVKSLVEHGVLGMIGFTPTDILHTTGEYVAGSVEAAKISARLMAYSRDMDTADFLAMARTKVTDKLCRTILQSAMDYQRFAFSDVDEDKTWESSFANAIWQQKDDILSINYHLNIPIIGIGAPIKAWLEPAAAKFGADISFPAHNDVANAVGAAAGKVMTLYHIKVQNHEQSCIGIYAPWGQIPFYAVENEEAEGEEAYANPDELMRRAIAKAIAEGKEKVREEMAKQGVKNYDILVDRKDVISGNSYNDSVRIHIETLLDIAAVGRPQWK